MDIPVRMRGMVSSNGGSKWIATNLSTDKSSEPQARSVQLDSVYNWDCVTDGHDHAYLP